MAREYTLNSLLNELQKLKKDFNDNYERPIMETSVMGLVPDPEKGSGLSKFRSNILSKVLKTRDPLGVSDELKDFTGSVVNKIDDNRANLSAWLDYIDEEELPNDSSYLDWRGLKGKAHKDILKKFIDAQKTYAIMDTAYGNSDVLADLHEEAKTTKKGGLVSLLERMPSYLLSAAALGLIGGGVGSSLDKGEGVKYGMGGGAALGILLNYIRRKNKYGGAANV